MKNDKNLNRSKAAERKAKALEALDKIQKKSVSEGKDKITLEEVNYPVLPPLPGEVPSEARTEPVNVKRGVIISVCPETAERTIMHPVG